MFHFRECAVVVEKNPSAFFTSRKNGIKLNDFIQIMRILMRRSESDSEKEKEGEATTTIIIIYMNSVYSGSCVFDVFFCTIKIFCCWSVSSNSCCIYWCIFYTLYVICVFNMIQYDEMWCGVAWLFDQIKKTTTVSHWMNSVSLIAFELN